MKKYKLKKDLPTWKAGEEFWIGEDECLYGLSEEGKPIMVYHAITLVNFGLLKNGEWLEEIIEKPKSIWDLEIGDFYFCILEDGEVEKFEILDEILFETYEKDLEVGNVFLTEEKAEKELERRKTIAKIKKWCWENGIELLEDHKIKNILKDNTKPYRVEKHKRIFYIFYNYSKNIFEISDFSDVRYEGILFFNTGSDVKKILEKFEEELKIILDV